MRYEVCVEGHLQPRWSSWLYNMQITHLPDGTTCLTGPLPDDAAVYGLLARLRDLGLTLVSVKRLPYSDCQPNDTSS